VVVIFRGSPDFDVVPFRLIFLGFGLIFWENSLWKELSRLYAVTLLTASLVPAAFGAVIVLFVRGARPIGWLSRENIKTKRRFDIMRRSISRVPSTPRFN
jgi:hypothetical protein